jgi:hypothetical protein
VQDTDCSSATGYPVRPRLVSTPSAPVGQGPARRAHKATPGHFNYFGVNGNLRSLKLLVEATKRAWYKWLSRRSQRGRLTWERFRALLEQFPLPRPRITVQIWGT